MIYQCVATVVIVAGEREPTMLLWEWRAGGGGMPALRPKYLQPMNLRPHILPFYGLVWLVILKQVDMTMVFSACPATPEQKSVLVEASPGR